MMSEKIGYAPTGHYNDSAARRTHWRGAAAPENLQSNSELATIVRELCAAYGHPLPDAALARSDAAIAAAKENK